MQTLSSETHNEVKKKKVFTHNIKYAQLEDFIANCLIIHLKRKVFHTQLLLTNDLG